MTKTLLQAALADAQVIAKARQKGLLPRGGTSQVARRVLREHERMSDKGIIHYPEHQDRALRLARIGRYLQFDRRRGGSLPIPEQLRENENLALIAKQSMRADLARARNPAKKEKIERDIALQTRNYRAAKGQIDLRTNVRRGVYKALIRGGSGKLQRRILAAQDAMARRSDLDVPYLGDDALYGDRAPGRRYERQVMESAHLRARDQRMSRAVEGLKERRQRAWDRYVEFPPAHQQKDGTYKDRNGDRWRLKDDGLLRLIDDDE